MASFQDRVDTQMTATVVTVSVDDDVQDAEALLRLHEISSVPVMGRAGDLAGVLSFRDLLNAGHVLGRMLGGRTALTLPSGCVGELMTQKPLVVAPDDTLETAARRILVDRVHRLYVTDASGLVGVISSNDLMRVVGLGTIDAPIAKYSTAPVLVIDAGSTLFHAVEMLASSFVSGLVVIDEGLPVGMFTQIEALAQKDLPAETRIGDVVEYSLISLPWRTPLHRAAALASRSRARRVLSMDGTQIQGILTSLDFVRAAVDAPAP